MSTIRTIIEINDEPTKVEVFFTYYAGCPGRDFLSSGDIGYQSEPPEVEIDRIFDAHGDITHVVTSEQINDIERLIIKQAYANRDI